MCVTHYLSTLALAAMAREHADKMLARQVGQQMLLFCLACKFELHPINLKDALMPFKGLWCRKPLEQ